MSEELSLSQESFIVPYLLKIIPINQEINFFSSERAEQAGQHAAQPRNSDMKSDHRVQNTRQCLDGQSQKFNLSNKCPCISESVSLWFAPLLL